MDFTWQPTMCTSGIRSKHYCVKQCLLLWKTPIPVKVLISMMTHCLMTTAHLKEEYPPNPHASCNPSIHLASKARCVALSTRLGTRLRNVQLWADVPSFCMDV